MFILILITDHGSDHGPEEKYLKTVIKMLKLYFAFEN